MKDLKDFIVNESNSSKLLKSLEDLAWGVIDYFNQEGVKDFTEDDWKKYVNGDKDPNYKEIVDAMVAELKEYGDKNNLLDTLKGYPSSDLKEDIELSILRAAQDYVKDL